ncbi:MAG: hypothetical protein AB1598_06030 [Thermodesulfobacteriota bacterium]
MNIVIKTVLKISLLVLVVTGIAGLTDSANAQSCFVGYCNVTVQGGHVEFSYIRDFGGGNTDEFFLGNGACSVLFKIGSEVVTQNETEGFVLDHVECDTGSGILVTEVENGVALECITQSTEGTCTFFNRPVESNIPTLSEWGMIAAAAGLGLVGVWFAVRRRRARAV